MGTVLVVTLWSEKKCDNENRPCCHITNKSWWETVDTFDAFVGEIVSNDNAIKTEMIRWASDENILLRRVAIDFQQKYKEKTDTKLLDEIICLNLGSK